MAYKLGIIGYGGMAGGYHIGTVRREDIPFEPAAAFDIDPARLAEAEKAGLKAYSNLDDFLAHEGGYDLVLVATPNNYHCEMACRTMEAGFNVMSEKPVAISSDELQKMIDTSEKCGKLFTVHQNRRWDRDFVMIRQAIAEGAVGKPYMIESRIQSPNGNGDMYNWRGMKDHGGGMLLDWGVHLLDQLLWLIKEPVKSVSANVFPLWSEEVDDYSKVIITFESGLVAQMEVVTYSPIALPRWMVYGDRGAMTMQDAGDAKIKVRRIKKDENVVIDVPAYVDHRMITRKQKRHFIEEFEEFEAPETVPNNDWGSVYKNLAGVLAGTEELIVKPAEVMRTFRVIEAAFKSAEEGVTVRF
ncbi:MAG: Gfo/Idh/MocA family oxidoreductase [Clostridia bacterium]|nr:Gfo/Idh/MocA family oxidoreductase [Clostridia bacterium]